MHSIKLGTSNQIHLLMLHGWGKSAQTLRPLGEILANYYQVHIFDLPGFGDSPVPDSVWGTKEYADRIIQYMDQEGIPSAHILGHSFGGRISLQIASNYPNRVNKLILIGTPGLKRNRTLKQSIRIRTIGLASKFFKKVDSIFKTDLFRTKFATKFGSPDYQNAGAMRPIFVKTVNEDYSSLIPTIKSETLLLWGSNDNEAPVEVGERMCLLISGSKFIALQGKGHEPYLGIGAQLCGQRILEFLTK